MESLCVDHNDRDLQGRSLLDTRTEIHMKKLTYIQKHTTVESKV